jgi:hypothetical protein
MASWIGMPSSLDMDDRPVGNEMKDEENGK